MDCSPEPILDYLNRAQVRCTYAAAAEVMGVPKRSIGRYLGDPRPYASWVVAKQTGEPTGYSDKDKHPQLHSWKHVITTGEELRRCMKREVTEFPE